MPNQKITDLTPLLGVNVDSLDVLPIVDVSVNETKKISAAELIIGLGIDLKVDENAAIVGATKTKITYDVKGLITAGADATTSDIADTTNKRYVTDAQLVVIGNTSGTNTGDNATNSQYSGLAASKQDTLISATNIKTVNSTTLLGSGNLAVQATLVSATNIKTINSNSLLGSGDLVVAAAPSGVSGAVQFSNGSAFASDATNFFWDDTNNRLGLGISASLLARLHLKGAGSTAATRNLQIDNAAGSSLLSIYDDGTINTNNNLSVSNGDISLLTTGKKFDSPDFSIGTVSSFSKLVNKRTGSFSTFQLPDQIAIAQTGNYNNPGSVAFAINSTTRGLMLSCHTTAERLAMTPAVNGLLVFDYTIKKLFIYSGTAWEQVTSV